MINEMVDFDHIPSKRHVICITVYSILVMRNSFHSILQPWEFFYATLWDAILHGIGWH